MAENCGGDEVSTSRIAEMQDDEGESKALSFFLECEIEKQVKDLEVCALRD